MSLLEMFLCSPYVSPEACDRTACSPHSSPWSRCRTCHSSRGGSGPPGPRTGSTWPWPTCHNVSVDTLSDVPDLWGQQSPAVLQRLWPFPEVTVGSGDSELRPEGGWWWWAWWWWCSWRPWWLWWWCPILVTTFPSVVPTTKRNWKKIIKWFLQGILIMTTLNPERLNI